MKNKKVTLFFPRLDEERIFHRVPQSLLSIAAVLSNKGFQISIVDSRVDSDWENTLLRECGDSFILGISAFTGYQVSFAYKAARLVHSRYQNLKIAWGGPHVSALPRESLLDDLVDMVIIGYGEHSTPAAFDLLYQGIEPEGIPGFLYKGSDGAIRGIPEPEQHPDFSDLPPLDYSLIDLEKYINPETQAFIYITSYGCSGICTYCATPVLRNYSKLNPERVILDIDHLRALHAYKKIVFFDATFFANEQNVRIIISHIAECHDIHEWVCDGRAVDLLKVGNDTLRLCRETNLSLIMIGLESGSQRVVEMMKKGKTHLEKYKQAIIRLKEFDFNIVSGVIFGMPGESLDDLRATLEYIQEIREINPRVRFSTTFFVPLPGTEMFHYVREHLGICFPKSLKEWAEYGDHAKLHYNTGVRSEYLDPSVREEYFKIYTDFWNERREWML